MVDFDYSGLDVVEVPEGAAEDLRAMREAGYGPSYPEPVDWSGLELVDPDAPAVDWEAEKDWARQFNPVLRDDGSPFPTKSHASIAKRKLGMEDAKVLPLPEGGFHLARAPATDEDRARLDRVNARIGREDAPEDETTTLGEIGEIPAGVAAGMVGTAGTALQGISAGFSPARDDIPEDRKAVLRTKMREAEAALMKGDAETYSRLTREIHQEALVPVTQRAGFQAGQRIRDWGERTFPATEGYEASFGRQVGEGVGSLLTGVAASAVHPGAAMVLFTTLGMGEAADRAATALSEQHGPEAVDKGEYDEQITRAAILGVGPGMTDQVPVEVLLKRLPVPGAKAVGQAIRSFGGERVMRAIGRIGSQAAIEAVQEGGQQALQNLIARNVHSPETEITEGVLPGAGVGGVVGGIAGVGREAVLNLAGRRSRSARGARAKAAEEVPPPSPEDEASPIPTETIVEGRKVVADAEGRKVANRILETEGMPEIGTPVRIGIGRKAYEGVVTDAWGEGPEAGITVTEADGTVIDSTLRELLEFGAEVEVLSDAYVEGQPEPTEEAMVDRTVETIDPEIAAQDRHLAELKSVADASEFAVEAHELAGKDIPLAEREARVSNALGLFGYESVADVPTTVRPAVLEAVRDQTRIEDAERRAAALADLPEGDVETTAPVETEAAPRQELDRGLTPSDIAPATPETAPDIAETAPETPVSIPEGDVDTTAPVETADVPRPAAVAPAAAEDTGGAPEVRPPPAPPTPSPEALPELDVDDLAPVETEAPPSPMRAEVEAAEAETNTEPTEGQKEAGNYAKGRVRIRPGIEIVVENPKGSERSGRDKDGNEWSVTMPATYGYLSRTEGADGDQVDVYVGPEPESDEVFLVDQVDADTRAFDEHKVMLGYATEEEALADYDAAFDDGRGPERRGAVTPMDMEDFRSWLANGDTRNPVGNIPIEPEALPAGVDVSPSPAPVERAGGEAETAEAPPPQPEDPNEPEGLTAMQRVARRRAAARAATMEPAEAREYLDNLAQAGYRVEGIEIPGEAARPEPSPEAMVDRTVETEAEVTTEPEIRVKLNGQPFGSERTAALAADQREMLNAGEFEIVPVEGGFGIRVLGDEMGAAGAVGPTTETTEEQVQVHTPQEAEEFVAAAPMYAAARNAREEGGEIYGSATGGPYLRRAQAEWRAQQLKGAPGPMPGDFEIVPVQVSSEERVNLGITNPNIQGGYVVRHWPDGKPLTTTKQAPEAAPEPAAEGVGISGQETARQLIPKNNGEPFKTARSAELAARSKLKAGKIGADYIVVDHGGGFAIEAAPPQGEQDGQEAGPVPPGREADRAVPPDGPDVGDGQEGAAPAIPEDTDAAPDAEVGADGGVVPGAVARDDLPPGWAMHRTSAGQYVADSAGRRTRPFATADEAAEAARDTAGTQDALTAARADAEARGLTGQEAARDVASQMEARERAEAAAPHQVPGSVPSRPVREVDRPSRVITPAGRRVDVQPIVVEARDLIASHDETGRENPTFPSEFQPRDRSRAASQEQIASMAGELIPELLMPSAQSAEGAPVVGPDRVVESGNARTLAVRRAYEMGLADDYRNHLVERGYEIDGFEQPVLVQQRLTSMTPEERAEFAREANARTTADRGASEVAQADAAGVTREMLELYAPGDIGSAGNREFVRSFVSGVVPDMERAGMMAADGTLSQAGKQRIENALFDKAYGDAELLGSLREDLDTNVKSLGGALLDAAPEWARMRLAVAEGSADQMVDHTEHIIAAVRMVRKARAEGTRLRELVAQDEMFSGDVLHPLAEDWLRSMYADGQNLTRPYGRPRLAEGLTFWADEAQKKQAGANMFGETVDEAEIAAMMDLTRRKIARVEQARQADAETQADLLGGVAAESAGTYQEGPGAAGAEPARPGRADAGRERGDQEGRERAERGLADPGVTDEFSPRQLALFADGEPGAVPDRPAGEAAPQAARRQASGIAKTDVLALEDVRVGLDHVRSPEDAAHVAAPFRKEPQETLIGIVLGEGDRLIGTIRHSVGSASSVPLDTPLFLGAIAQIPEARAFYIAHQHPSGTLSLSAADKAVNRNIADLTRNTGLDYRGSVVVAPGGRKGVFDAPDSDLGHGRSIDVTPAPRRQAAPVYRRRWTQIPPQSPRVRVSSSTALEAAAREHLPELSGIMFLDNSLNLVGTMALDTAEMSRLRGPGGAARDIYEAFAETNASRSAILARQGEGGRGPAMDALENMRRFARALSKVGGNGNEVDAILYDANGKVVLHDREELSPGTFLQRPMLPRQTRTADGQPYEDLSEDFFAEVPDPRAPGGQEAIGRFLDERAGETGAEYMVVVDSQSGDAHVGSGATPDAVGFPLAVIESLDTGPAEKVIYHNHPLSSALSPNDIGFAYSAGVKGIVARGADGTVTAVRTTEQGQLAVEELAQRLSGEAVPSGDTVRRAGTVVASEVRVLAESVMADRVATGEMTNPEVMRVANDFTNRVLHEMGLIEYGTSFSDTHAGDAVALAQQIKQQGGLFREIRNADQSPVVLRGFGDVGGAFGLREDPGPGRLGGKTGEARRAGDLGPETADEAGGPGAPDRSRDGRESPPREGGDIAALRGAPGTDAGASRRIVEPILKKNGQPFGTRKSAAAAAKSRGLDAAPVEVPGGWGLEERDAERVSRDDRDSRAQRLEGYEGAVPYADAQVVPVLRRERGEGVPGVEGELSGIPTGRWDEAGAGIDVGAAGQQQGIRARERDLGLADTAEPQLSAEQAGDVQRPITDDRRVGEGSGVALDDAAPPTRERVERRASPDTTETTGQEARVRIRPTRRFDAERLRIRAEIEATGQRAFGKGFNIRLADEILTPEGGQATGAFDPAARIAYIALRDPGEMTGTLYHEGIHYLRRAGAFTKQDGTPTKSWQVLEAEAPKWRQKYKIDERYPAGIGEDLLVEESIAEAIDDYAKNKPPEITGKVKLAMDRILAFWKRLGNAIRGRGFQTATDVFEGIQAGDFAGPSGQTDAQALDRYLQTAWHASPYEFDRFSTEFIGEGEGAQAYGWGMYFAEREGVADWYRENFAGRQGLTNAQLREYFEPGRVVGVQADGTADRVVSFNEDTSDPNWPRWSVTVESVRMNEDGEWVARPRPGTASARRNHSTMPSNQQYEQATGKKVQPPKYRVDLAPKESEYLHWDRQLAAQSKDVRGALREMGRAAKEYQTGEDIYREAANELGSDRAASEALLAAGIRGIKYLDQSSRPMGGAMGMARMGLKKPSYNYVIFDDSDVAIEEIMLQRERLGEFETEPGAEGVDQAVIPGTEPLTERQLAERRMQGRMTTDREQRPMDEGLFGEAEGEQGTLFQRIPAENREAFEEAASQQFGVDMTGAAEVAKEDKNVFAKWGEELGDQLLGPTRKGKAEGIQVLDIEDPRDLNAALRWLAPPGVGFAKKSPELHKVWRQGVKAEIDQSVYIGRLNREWDGITRPLDKAEFEQLTGLMFLGDAEARAFTDEELDDFGVPDKVKTAYKGARRFLDKLGRWTEQHERNMKVDLLRRRSALIRDLAGRRGMAIEAFRELYKERSILKGHMRHGRGNPNQLAAEIQDADERLHGEMLEDPEYRELAGEADSLEARLENTTVRRRSGYVPHKFFGDWAISAADPEGKTFVPIAEEGPEVQGPPAPVWSQVAGEHGHFPSRMAALKAAKEYKKAYPNKLVIVKPVEFQFPDSKATVLTDAAYRSLRERVSRLMEVTGEDLDAVLDGVARPRNRRRFAGFEQYREGMPGFNKNLDRVIRAHIGETVRYSTLDKLKYDAITAMEKEGLQRSRVTQERPELQKAVEAFLRDVNGQKQPLETQVDSILNRPWATPLRVGLATAGTVGAAVGAVQSSAFAGALIGSYVGFRVTKSLAQGGQFPSRAVTAGMLSDMSHLKLGMLFNMSSAMVNLSQTALTTYPVLGGKHTMAGMRRFQAAMLSNMRGKPNADWKALLKHDINPTFGFTEGTKNQFQKESNVSKLSMLPFTAAESFNRAVAFLGGMNKAEAQGQDWAKAVDQGRRAMHQVRQREEAFHPTMPGPAMRHGTRVIERTQFHYGSASKPELLRGNFLRVPLQFKNFMAQMLTFTFGLRGKEIPRFVLALGLTAGALGMVGIELLDWILQGLTGGWSLIDGIKEGALKMAAEGELEGGVGQLVARGVPGLVGVDLSTRTGLGDKFLPAEARDLYGPWYSTVKNAARHAAEGASVIEQVRNLSPGLGNPLRAIEAAGAGGQVSNAWKRGRPEMTYTPGELTLKATGFRPVRESMEQDWRDIMKRRADRARLGSRRYIDRAVRAIQNGQRRRLTEIMREAADAGTPITPGQLRGALKGMITERAQRTIRTLPRSLQGEARDLRRGLDRAAP